MNTTATDSARPGWRADWGTSLFTAVFLPLLVALGFWQLERAAEKEHILASWEQRRALPPAPLSSLAATGESLAYRPVLLQGAFLRGRDFLLDNRVRQGRFGVEVISPFRLADSGLTVLVNRGWMAADPGRRQLPAVPDPVDTAVLQGTIHIPPGEPYLLGELAVGDAWPRLVQAADVGALGEMLGEPVMPYTVRLAADSPSALVAEWPLVNASPAKHRGYAFQWFTMAAVLALFYLWRSTNIGEWLGNRRSARR